MKSNSPKMFTTKPIALWLSLSNIIPPPPGALFPCLFISLLINEV